MRSVAYARPAVLTLSRAARRPHRGRAFYVRRTAGFTNYNARFGAVAAPYIGALSLYARGYDLPVHEASLDGEAVAHCETGLPDFHRTVSSAGQRAAYLLAFDLLAINGEDLRPLPLLARGGRLQALLAGAGPALRFSEHMDGEHGEAMFRHACAMGLEGIVSKKVTAPYLSGRRSSWLKVKNLAYVRRGGEN